LTRRARGLRKDALWQRKALLTLLRRTTGATHIARRPTDTWHSRSHPGSRVSRSVSVGGFSAIE